MNKLNSCLIFCVVFLFVICEIAPSIIAQPDDKDSNYLDYYKENEKEITLYKVDITGRVQPVNTIITLDENQDEDELIAKKCKELFEEDEDMQRSICTLEDNAWVEIESMGKGFHWSFRRMFLTNRTVIWRTMIKFRYFYAVDYTNIRYNGSEDWTPLLEGPQKIRLIGFTGYINFKPRIFWGKTIIHGYALGLDWATPRWPKNGW